MFKNKNSFLLYVIFFLSFVGFYIIVLLLVSLNLTDQTRLVTIPTRLLLGLCLGGLVLLNRRKSHPALMVFSLFAIAYFFRILLDSYLGNKSYQSTSSILFYFISFAIVPFFAVSSFKLHEDYLKVIRKSISFSSLIFAVLAIFSYQQFIGTVGRLTSSTGGGDDSVISPLILSYCSTLGIGVAISYVMYNKTSLFTKLLAVITIGLSVVPFFLGATRGALIALFIPFVVMVAAKRNLIFLIKSLAILVLALIAVVYLDSALNSGLIDRITNISTDIDQSNNSAVRLIMWQNSLEQFMNNPIIGDKLAVDGFDGYYPHNIVLEVLQATGIVGFIPFAILLIKAFLSVFRLFRLNKKYSWIGVIFLQSFCQNMFSGSIYLAAWFWVSMALVFSFDTYAKNEQKKLKIKIQEEENDHEEQQILHPQL